MSPAQRVADRFAAGEIQNLPRLERIVTSIESEAKQMVAALNKYKQDPGKYAPQLENLVHSADMIGSSLRVLLRTLGKPTE